MPKDKKEQVQGLGSIMYSIELRDIFAAFVFAGVAAGKYEDMASASDQDRARFSYRQADALLAARGEKR